MDHFFFVHSPVDGHFRFFQVLAIVNIAAVQDYQLLSFGFWSSLVTGQVVGLPDHMVADFLPLNVPPFCFHLRLLPVYIAPAAKGYTVL